MYHVYRKPRSSKVSQACSGVCRDCGTVRAETKSAFRKSTPPRCFVCGGMLDRSTMKALDRCEQKRKDDLSAATEDTYRTLEAVPTTVHDYVGRPIKAGHVIAFKNPNENGLALSLGVVVTETKATIRNSAKSYFQPRFKVVRIVSHADGRVSCAGRAFTYYHPSCCLTIDRETLPENIKAIVTDELIAFLIQSNQAPHEPTSASTQPDELVAAPGKAATRTAR